MSTGTATAFARRRTTAKRVTAHRCPSERACFRSQSGRVLSHASSASCEPAEHAAHGVTIKLRLTTSQNRLFVPSSPRRETFGARHCAPLIAAPYARAPDTSQMEGDPLHRCPSAGAAVQPGGVRRHLDHLQQAPRSGSRSSARRERLTDADASEVRRTSTATPISCIQ
jgi:hypothetical protein